MVGIGGMSPGMGGIGGTGGMRRMGGMKFDLLLKLNC